MVVAPVPARAVRLAVPLVVAALALALPAPAGANHVQMDSGRVIVFDHLGGNADWVELGVAGQDGGQVSGISVRTDVAGAPWVAMQWHADWGKWTAGTHIPVGARVQFRAMWAGGAMQDSCWFTHPAGVEQCGSSPPPSGFDASFTGVRGNEWWVQAQVATNGPAVAKVDVRLYSNGVWGAFMPVAKQSWGWGSSYHITQGTIVQLRATASDGQTDLSSCRQWIPAANTDATIVACPGTAPPFDATFTGVKGNEWWAQVNVAANQAIDQVAIRVDCGIEWSPMQHASWGGWTYSAHLPAGTRVDFQARSTSQASDVSGTYLWTNAAPTTACPQGDWPHQGSTATYSLGSAACGGGNCEDVDATARALYDHGQWTTTCTGKDTFYAVDGTTTVTPWTSTHVGVGPSWLTPRTQVGAQVTPMLFAVGYGAHKCSVVSSSSPLFVQSHGTYQTALKDANGDPVTVDAWQAVSNAPEDNVWSAHWDTRIGLVLDVDSEPRMSEQGGGGMTLVGTDAPLR